MTDLETAVRKLRTAEAGVPRAQERAAQIIAAARDRVDQARADLPAEIRAADRAGMRQMDIVAAANPDVLPHLVDHDVVAARLAERGNNVMINVRGAGGAQAGLSITRSSP